MSSETSNAYQTDEMLVRSARQGDRTAFALLLQRYTRPVAQFARAHTRTIQDAEDIVQETFLRAYQKLDSFDPQRSMKNWLFTIAYRLIISASRKKQPPFLSETAAGSLAAAPASPAEQDDWLWQQVRQLEPADCTVLWLRYQQDLAMNEIARIMKKTPLGVRVQLHRARNRLACKLAACAESNESVPAPIRGLFSTERVK